MCVVIISSRYQITIPKEIREQFDIKPGDKALFVPHEKTIELVFAHSKEEFGRKEILAFWNSRVFQKPGYLNQTHAPPNLRRTHP
jgi:AbrB family looped-hinge helix DNA binding protein